MVRRSIMGSFFRFSFMIAKYFKWIFTFYVCVFY